MRKLLFIFLVVCSTVLPLLNDSEPPVIELQQTEAEVSLISPTEGKRILSPDKVGLKQLLDDTLQLQPCTAGCSLRLAVLGGSFYRWYIDNAGQSEAAKQAALAWRAERCVEERRQAAAVILSLRKAAEHVREEELLALLDDAGIVIPEGEGYKEGFLYLTDAVSRVLLTEIFKNHSEIMNNSR